MNSIIRQYKILVDFLGKALGPNYEIVLYDLTDNDNSITAIANGHISGRKEGAPLTDLALQFIKNENYQSKDYEVNYRGVTKNNTYVNSSTMFIKDDDGKLIGMLCINFDVNKFLSIMDGIAGLFQINSSKYKAYKRPTLHKNNIETFSNSLSELVESALHKVIGNANISKERLTQEEKMKIVDVLNKNGVFLLKGAVSEVAQQLYCSEASIYRYLSKLNKSSK